MCDHSVQITYYANFFTCLNSCVCKLKLVVSKGQSEVKQNWLSRLRGLSRVILRPGLVWIYLSFSILWQFTPRFILHNKLHVNNIYILKDENMQYTLLHCWASLTFEKQNIDVSQCSIMCCCEPVAPPSIPGQFPCISLL